jgi:uncharacterized protein (TIGR02246 family)
MGAHEWRRGMPPPLCHQTNTVVETKTAADFFHASLFHTMRNILFCTLAFFFASLLPTNAQAQNPEAEILSMWDNVWKAYESNNLAKVWASYAENACEIYPDGSMMTGAANIKAGYEQFSGMLEGTPSWQSTKPAIRLITPDVALLTSSVVSDIKLKGGQQVGGKSVFALVAHKVKGQWLIEFDSQTPVLQMPGN